MNRSLWVKREEWGGLSDESVKKGKFVMKIFFSDNVKWNSKNLWNMMSVDVKTSIKQQEIKYLVAHLTNFSTFKTWNAM